MLILVQVCVLSGGTVVRAQDVADGGAFDLVVVGGTPGGIACAVRAAREGLAVLLEPVWMQTGEAAAFAAAQAIRDRATPADINVDRLLRTLAEHRAMISFFNDVDVASGKAWVPAVEFLATTGPRAPRRVPPSSGSPSGRACGCPAPTGTPARACRPSTHKGFGLPNSGQAEPLVGGTQSQERPGGCLPATLFRCAARARPRIVTAPPETTVGAQR